MKLVENLVAIILFGCAYICVMYLCIDSDVGDYLQYTENPEIYQIQTVKVESIRSRYRIHSDTATFYYYDKYGLYKQGWVYVNYDENVGDYIEVAFDEQGGYIRPIITVAEGGVLDYIIWLVVGVIFIRGMIVEIRENGWW